MKLTDLLSLLGRLLVGGVLVYAGFSKALAPSAEFAGALAAYHLFPTALLTPLSIAMPWIEIWTGLFLIAGLYTTIAAGCATALFAGFLTVLTTARLRHIDLTSCGCFGAETFSPQTTLKLDIALLVVSVLLLTASRSLRRWTLDSSLV
jgi:putative oxidoreductase